MKYLYILIIKYTNGSIDRLPFDQYDAVQDMYQHGISYSGGRVSRVEVDMTKTGGGIRAIWDTTWNEESKLAGLTG